MRAGARVSKMSSSMQRMNSSATMFSSSPLTDTVYARNRQPYLRAPLFEVTAVVPRDGWMDMSAAGLLGACMPPKQTRA